jgi:hypothetical protein
MKKLLCCTTLLSVAMLPATLLADNTGSLGGIVVDHRDHPAADVTVAYRLLQPGRMDKYGHQAFTAPAAGGSVTTGSDGRFSVAGLRPGRYALCALAKLPNQLHSCQWGGSDGPWQVAAGRQAADARLVLRSGVRINVHVADTSGNVDVADVIRGPAYGRRLLLGIVSDRGEYYGAHLASKGQGQLTYGLTVPADRAVKLVIDTDFDVTDAAGSPVPSRKPRPITEPQGPNGIDVNLVVRGRP